MSTPRRSVGRNRWCTLAVAFGCALLTPCIGFGSEPTPEPFARFSLPDEWEARFWGSDNAKALFAMSPKGVANLVPTQAGVRFCRCPSCDASEADDPLTWSVVKPKSLTCKKCGVVVPNDKFPANEKDKKEPPEVTVEVLPRVVHHYPYHAVDAVDQRYPGERLFLAARADDEARQFLAKAALYAALRYRRQAQGKKDPALAGVASIIILRFAQVYPAYATHFDQPGAPKFFQEANLAPPYRDYYQTGKWDWKGSQNVPLNLLIAYALLRDDHAFVEAGLLLKVEHPARLIEHDLFRASAEFAGRQTEEPSEDALEVDRGILAVGRLLNDPVLVRDALDRLDRFASTGFYLDGFWRQANANSHARVLGHLDGWIDRLLAGYAAPAGLRGPDAWEATAVPMLALAREANAAPLSNERPESDLLLASWPGTVGYPRPHTPRLLGGTGIARLALGQGDNAFDIELRGLDAFAPSGIRRQSLRVGVGGRPVLDDLDETVGLPSGFDLASASHNTVIVNGLNQRESIAKARLAAAGGDFLFYAADPDFQAVTLDDPRSYPQLTTRYRQTVVASAPGRSRYALAVFEVRGGNRHDQFFHAPAGSRARWQLRGRIEQAPASLLPQGLTFLPTARAEDDRWFVQAYGEFTPVGQAEVVRPTQAWCVESGRGIKLHTLGDIPATALTALSPDPLAGAGSAAVDGVGRGSLLLRRQSAAESGLESLFVTLFEPVSPSIPPLEQVSRITSPGHTIVVSVKTAEGGEYLVVNLTPGTARTVTFPDGQSLRTDGLTVRVSASGMTLAGGTFAEFRGRRLVQAGASGRITGAFRQSSPGSRGGFETATRLANPESLAGRVVVITHGDGTTHGWTISRVETLERGSKIHVREEPGFGLDPATQTATFYQFPHVTLSGPHQFRISRIARE